MKYFENEIITICCALIIITDAISKSETTVYFPQFYDLGFAVADSDSSYDYSANTACKAEPLAAQYGGGLLKTSDFKSGFDGWKVNGNATIIIKKSTNNNHYLVAYNRSEPTDGFSRSIDVQKDYLYTFSAWFQVSEGEETIVAYTSKQEETVAIGSVIAKSGCWSMLKGGFTADDNIKMDLIFKCSDTAVEVWIDNVSLKQFTKAQWRSHQEKSIEKIRKRKINIRVMNSKGEKMEGANISLTHTRPLFTIGGGTPASILDSKMYQDYFTSRFTAATPHNELKWYSTENLQDQEDYKVADAMVSFFKKHNIAVRGHCILWDGINVTQYWVRALPPREVLHVSVRRIASIVSRYSGSLLAWDVMNENLHNSYFESVLGANASAMFYQIVRAIDPHTPLFLNEYNTLEYPSDLKVIPHRYLHKIREIKSFPGNEDMVIRIGLQAHFFIRPNMSYIRSAFDVLGSSGMPIWLTELDVNRNPKQAEQLEDVMREAFAHPAMEGMIVWGGWKPTSCNDACLNVEDYYHLPKECSQMCLIDNNFKNLPTGDVVDKLLKEWKSNAVGVTNKDGVFSDKLFHGDYNVTCSHPSLPNTLHSTFSLDKEEGSFDLSLTLK